MDKKNRRKSILEKVKTGGSVRVKELAEEFQVSEMTIRRDLEYLEDKNEILRTRGGAVSRSETPFPRKRIRNMDKKRQIADKARDFIASGQTLILDAGTTTLALAQNIKFSQELTIITSDLNIAGELFSFANITLYFAGGLIQTEVGSAIGPHAENFFDEFYVDLAFIGTSSLTEDFDLTTPTPEKAALKRKMIDSADRSFLLADHTKYRKKSVHRVCHLSSLDYFICDDEKPEFLEKRIAEEVPEIELN